MNRNSLNNLTRLSGLALYACGFTYVLLSPFQLVLRSFTASPAISAWKEALQCLGLCVLFVHVVFCRGRGLWSIVAYCCFAIVLVLLPSVRKLQDVDAVLLIVGPSIAGYFFFCETRRIYLEGRVSIPLKVIFAGAIVGALWVSFGTQFGMDRFVAREDLGMAGLLVRGDEGLIRLAGTFDSPMDAGQYMWLMGVVALAAAMFVRKMTSTLALLVVTAICYLAIFFTVSRGPYIVAVLATPMVVGASLWGRVPGRMGKIVLVGTGVIAGLLLLAAVFDTESTQTQLRIFKSSADSSESSNHERNTRLQEGWRATEKYFPVGRGLYWFPVRNLTGTGLIYENTYLGLGAAIGLRGILIGLLYACVLCTAFYMGALNAFKRKAPAALMMALSGPWVAYSMLYPQFQARFASIVSWSVIGIAIGCYSCLKEMDEREGA